MSNTYSPEMLSEPTTEWAALRTRPHWEKRLAELLAGYGVPVFLPTMTRLRKYASKERATEVPLFGEYVFCSVRDFIGNRLLTSGVQSKVVRLLRDSDPDRLRRELKAIADLLTDRQLVQERLVGNEGDLVRLVGTSFIGHHGTIVKVKPNRWKLVVKISLLGRSCEMEVDEWMVERVL